jgi:phosphoglycerate dehydrogenase-like enzyme
LPRNAGNDKSVDFAIFSLLAAGFISARTRVRTLRLKNALPVCRERAGGDQYMTYSIIGSGAIGAAVAQHFARMNTQVRIANKSKADPWKRWPKLLARRSLVAI